MTLEPREQATPETLKAVDTLPDTQTRKADAIRAFPEAGSIAEPSPPPTLQEPIDDAKNKNNASWPQVHPSRRSPMPRMA